VADITMCNNRECKYILKCYRYIALPKKIGQQYLANPKEDCENNDYFYYDEAKGR
jgi:hypothetical protein